MRTKKLALLLLLAMVVMSLQIGAFAAATPTLTIYADREVVGPGETIQLHYHIANMSNYEYTNITLVDDTLGDIATDINLTPGDYYESYVTIAVNRTCTFVFRMSAAEGGTSRTLTAISNELTIQVSEEAIAPQPEVEGKTDDVHVLVPAPGTEAQPKPMEEANADEHISILIPAPTMPPVVEQQYAFPTQQSSLYAVPMWLSADMYTADGAPLTSLKDAYIYVHVSNRYADQPIHQVTIDIQGRTYATIGAMVPMEMRTIVIPYEPAMGTAFMVEARALNTDGLILQSGASIYLLPMHKQK